jgi:histidine triad (HIT) family protein
VNDACVFCRILARELPGSLVYEDDDVVGFLDLFPVQPGHTLVVPRQHVMDLMHCPDPLAGRLLAACARVAAAVVAATGAEGFNVWTANGRVAGQTVFHLHLHVLPRFPADRLGLQFPKGSPREAAREELEEVAERIRAAV